MNKKIQKLKSYLDKYLGKTDLHVIKELGNPLEEYFDDTLIYTKPYKIFFRDEIVFFIEKGKVADIAITECFLWIGLRNVFYFQGEIPEYKIIKLF